MLLANKELIMWTNLVVWGQQGPSPKLDHFSCALPESRKGEVIENMAWQGWEATQQWFGDEGIELSFIKSQDRADEEEEPNPFLSPFSL